MKAEKVIKQLNKCQKNGEEKNAELQAEQLDALLGKQLAENELTAEAQDFIKYMLSALPPAIGRAEVGFFLPGIVKPQTLAQADSAGRGPEIAWRLGRKVAYRTDSLLLWLVKRVGFTRLVSKGKLTENFEHE